MPGKPRMFGSHGSHVWLACLAHLARWLAGSHIGHTRHFDVINKPSLKLNGKITVELFIYLVFI